MHSVTRLLVGANRTRFKAQTLRLPLSACLPARASTHMHMYKIFTHTNSGVCVRFAIVSATLGHLVLNLLAACWCSASFFAPTWHLTAVHPFIIFFSLLQLCTEYVYVCNLINAADFLPYLGSCIVRVEQGFCLFLYSPAN
jgi:hypothetical protein